MNILTHCIFFFIFPSLWNNWCTLTCRHLQTCMLTLQSSSSSHLRSSIKHTAVSKCELFMQRCELTAHISLSDVEILSCWPFCLFCMANIFTLTLIFSNLPFNVPNLLIFYSSVYFRRIKMEKIRWATGRCVHICTASGVKVGERACTLLKT